MDNEIAIPTVQTAERSFTGKRRPPVRHSMLDRLNSPMGYGILLLCSLGIGTAIALTGIKTAILILVGMVALPIVYILVVYPRIGITIFLTMAYLIMWFLKMGVPFPLGTLMDGMEALFILGLLLKIKKKPEWHLFKGPVGTMILLWIVYNIVEVANPSAESRLAWVYTVRSVAVVMVMYFVFVFNIRTKEFIKFIFKLWLGLALFAAAYAWKQEHIGFFPFEDRYLHSDPGIAGLLFIGGVWRKFSIFSDPVVFAYTMAVSSLMCFGLMTGPLPTKKKLILLGMAMFYIMNMLYSGTRGAYVLIPAAMILFAILKYNKKVMMAAVVAAAFFVIIINIPTSNYTLFRFQSAFKPSNDASYNLRKMNQKRIQPYILSHPLGGGLGATGEWGLRFAPWSYLAHFPPDSGYVRVAVEMGWIGLFILCFLMFTILRTGINNYYHIRDPELKSWCLGLTMVIFAFNIGNFPQEALVQYPSNVYFYLVTALIVVVRRIDDQQNNLPDGKK